MTHYEKEKWILYKSNLISKEETIEMEDHLYTCDRCMDIFLSLIDSEEVSHAESSIPDDFTENIMKKIDSVIPITKPTSKVANKSKGNSTRKKKMIENIFMYYVAVASVVLVLTAGGVFTKITEFPIEKIQFDSERTNEGLGNLYSLSDKISNATNSFINNIGELDTKENNGRIKLKNNKIWKKIIIKKQGGK